MQAVLPIYPVTDLRNQAKNALAEAANQPVVITQNGRASAVLLGYELYNEIVEKLERLEHYQQQERADWSAMSEPALQRVWDNDADAAYDDWKEMYGV
jgi:prevent-host-death family protein